MVLDSKQISLLLGIKKDSVRFYKNKGILGDKLKAVGYNLISTYKEGRYSYFVVEHEGSVSDISHDAAVVASTVFDVKHDKYPDFYIKQTSISRGVDSTLCSELTNTGMGKSIGVNRNTIKKWKDQLHDMDILQPGGILYIRVSKGNVEKATKEEHAAYMRMLRVEKDSHTALMLAYKDGKVSKEVMEIKHQEYMDHMKQLSSSYITKIKTSKLNILNPIHQEVIRIFLKKDNKDTQ